MSEPALLVSSSFHGIILVIVVLYAIIYKRLPTHIIFLLIIVIITSLLNHILTNKIIKWIDRIIVTLTLISLAIYVLYNDNTTNSNVVKYAFMFVIFIIIALYLFTKYTKYQYINGSNANMHKNYVLYHIACHMLGTFLIAYIVLAM
jgi:hypothetical protein